MCVSKGSQALLSGAQKHLIEITFKLRKRNSDDSSHTPQRGHTLRKSKERKILLRQKYGVKGTKAPAHPACVCRCVSHHLRCLLPLSLHISLTQTREEQRERSLSGERGIKAKRAAHSVAEFRTRRKRNNWIFPGRNIRFGKRERETDDELLSASMARFGFPRRLYLPRLRRIRRRLRRPRSPGGARVRESDTFPRRR